MKTKTAIFLALLCYWALPATSLAHLPTSFFQTRPGSLEGIVREQATGDVLPFAAVIVKTGEVVVASAQTDFDGRYSIAPIPPGRYDVYCYFQGFADTVIKGVQIDPDRPAVVHFQMRLSTEILQEVAVVYEAPLIDGSRGTRVTVTSDEIMNMPTRDISGIAAQTAGVFQADDGAVTTIRGARDQQAIYFIDGVKVRGSVHLPHASANNEAFELELEEEIDRRALAENEEYNGLQENPFDAVLSAPFSTFSIDVDGGAYTNTRRFLQSGYLPPKDAVRIEEFINYFRFDYPNPEGPHPFGFHSEISTCPWNENHQLLKVGIQGLKMDHEDLPPSNLVFLMDVSGSMDEPDKLPLLKASFLLLLEQLRPEDRVAIVVYAGAAGLVLPSTPCLKKEQIIAAVDGLQAGGSTAGGAGIELAYQVAEKHHQKGMNSRVILATDGDFNVGVSSQDALIDLIEKKRESGIFLSVLGFGTGNYKEARMEQLANHGNGNYSYIDQLMEAQKVLVEEMGGTLLTIAKDVKIQLEFNPAKVLAYRLIGFENRILNKEDFEDDQKDAGELGAGHRVTALYELIPRTELEQMPAAESKYQTLGFSEAALNSNEVGMLRFRYKAPDGRESQLIEVPMEQKSGSFEEASQDFRFAAAVAGFGMLLKESEYAGNLNYKEVIRMAKDARGEDAFGYRAEFIRLVQLAKDLHPLASNH